jgi:hypothetical protein
MKHPYVFVFMIGCALSQIGCGDDSGGSGGAGSGAAGSGGSATCEKVAACGGDLAGEWKMTQICVEQPGTTEDIKAICESAKLEINSTTVTGSLSYKAADMTFTQSTTLDATATLVLPASCLKAGSTTYTCQQLQDIFKADPGAMQIACTSSSDGGCNCKNPVHEVTSNTGTYAISGSTVTLTTAKDKGTAEYCVKGSKLYLHTTVSSGTTMGGDFTPSGQLVLEKQ